MTPPIEDNEVVDERLGIIYGQLLDAGDVLNEEIAFKAIRAAYMRGYQDATEYREATEAAA